MSPEQMRKKSEAQAEALRHARYAQADGGMNMGAHAPSEPIEAARKRVNAATAKEDADIGGRNASINDNRY